MMRRLAFIGAAALLLAAVGCSSGDTTTTTATAGSGGSPTTVSGSTTPTGIPPTAAGGSPTVSATGVRPTLPNVTIPGGVGINRAKLSMKLSGAETFDGPLSDEAACTTVPGTSGPTLAITGKSGDAAINFLISNPKDGTFPIGAPGGSGSGTRAEALTVLYKGKTYVAIAGDLKLTDAAGKKGSASATQFVAAPATSPVALKADVTWECG